MLSGQIGCCSFIKLNVLRSKYRRWLNTRNWCLPPGFGSIYSCLLISSKTRNLLISTKTGNKGVSGIGDKIESTSVRKKWLESMWPTSFQKRLIFFSPMAQCEGSGLLLLFLLCSNTNYFSINLSSIHCKRSRRYEQSETGRCWTVHINISCLPPQRSAPTLIPSPPVPRGPQLLCYVGWCATQEKLHFNLSCNGNS